MKTRLFRFGLILVLFATLMVLPVSSEKGLIRQMDGKSTAVYEVSQADQEAGLRMWATQEQRAAAQPLPWPEVSAEEFKVTAEEPTGKPGFAPGEPPDPQADITAQAEFPEEWQALVEEFVAEEAADVEPQGTAAVFTGFRTNYYTQMWKYFPYRAVGKLYISGAGYCSASVISSGPTSKNGYRSIIVTAGHCVYDRTNNRWYPGWTFYPAYRNGAAYGGFTGWRARTLTNYITTGARRYDVAVISLNSNSAGQEVSYYTGTLGRSWNYGYTQLLVAQGYPSNLSTGTLYSFSCHAESFSGGTDVLGMGCDMTYGSSGGPWIRTFKPYQSGANNYVNSVVSGGTPGTNTFYGARFSSYNIVPLCNDEGC